MHCTHLQGAAIGEYSEMSALLRGFVLFAEGKLAETRRIGKRLIEMCGSRPITHRATDRANPPCNIGR